jgi:toxin-antitoxin system PIN domain toxin
MKILLDVNLLFVLHQPRHMSFQSVFGWFAHSQESSFATCAITQAGLFRLLLQGVNGMDSFSVNDARKTIQRFSSRPNHIYWSEMPACLDAIDPFFPRIQGHRQITDAYLLGLAIHHGGKLATLDKAILHLAGPEFAPHVELIAS